jgi:DNA-binding LytR/AlgR family response regulator
MTHVAIVEDDRGDMQVLQKYLQKFSSEFSETFDIRTFHDGQDLADDYRAIFDILLLDIQMPGLDGMKTAAQIRELDEDVIIIFITSTSQYAVQGYLVDALGYVLKPVSYLAFSQLLQKALRKIKSGKGRGEELVANTSAGSVRVGLDRVLYFESQLHAVLIHTECDTHRTAGPFKKYIARYEALGFAKCHNSYFVNLAHVTCLKHNDILLSNGRALPISRTYRQPFLAGLLTYSFGWFSTMVAAFFCMFLCILALCKVSVLDALYCCARAVMLAETSNSLSRLLHYGWFAIAKYYRASTSWILMSLAYLPLLAGYFLLERRHFPQEKVLAVDAKDAASSLVLSFSAFFLSNPSIFTLTYNPDFAQFTFTIRFLLDLCALSILFVQQDRREEYRIRGESQALAALFQRQYEQYKLERDNMDFLKKELHDLKHYLLAMQSETDPDVFHQYFSEMLEGIELHEAQMETGNRTLDVILTTKKHQCLRENITFNCMANGALLEFMDKKDICSIFGDALDNAIECVGQYGDPEKRILLLNVYQQDYFVMIQVENYSENRLVLKDSLPVTTKPEKTLHGYGLKSIRQTVEKYGGTLTLHHENNWFSLQVLLPVA